MSHSIFDIYSPTTDYCVGVISIPHSGLIIPEEINPYLVSEEIIQNQDVDFGVHSLIDIEQLRANGITIIKSHIHRIAIDLNRRKELAVLNWKENSKGKKLVIKEPENSLKQKWEEQYHTPYFKTLESTLNYLMDQSENRVSFIDLHSMPSKATEYHLKKNPDQKVNRPDFCLSDQFGKSCDPYYIETFFNHFKGLGYHPTINDPYVGGYITQHFMDWNLNNIQIEIKRSLYMDEDKIELLPNSEKLKKDLTNMFINLFKTIQSHYNNHSP